MNKIKKGRELHKYLSRFGEDYPDIIASKARLDQKGVASAIKKDRTKIHATEFYYCVADVGGDIGEACDDIFHGLDLPIYNKGTGTDPNKTRLANYLEHLIVEQKDIAKKIDTPAINLSHNVSGLRKIYAYQIYFLSKAHRKSASDVFEFLYGASGIGIIT